ncbi:hypothetical protein [Psychromonas algicola]|uniref:hypothetical protein n=1 Tax=Psychromonas algicola TaxID=2555642 RepID=UPI001067C2AD|nr:hypothetical protein [Psychromonas sp. RZ5]TEW52554.1 hypothetical protein E2R67_02680 [Psychromonas sp. RZ5]
MKTPLFFITVLTLVFSSVVSAKSIDSLAEYETDLVACLSTAKASKVCLTKLSGEYFYTEGTLEKGIDTIVNSYLTWIGENSVFHVYKVNDIHKGDFQVKQDFIVENTKGNLFVVSISYRKKLGMWQLNNITVSSKKNKISEILSL